LGPLVFCSIMVQPLLLSLASELTLQYLNDFTLGGDVATVTQDVSRIAELGSKDESRFECRKVSARDPFWFYCGRPSSSVLQSCRAGRRNASGSPTLPR